MASIGQTHFIWIQVRLLYASVGMGKAEAAGHFCLCQGGSKLPELAP